MTERVELPCYFSADESCPGFCPIYDASKKVVASIGDPTINTLEMFAQSQKLYLNSLSDEDRTALYEKRIFALKQVDDPSEHCLNYEERQS